MAKHAADLQAGMKGDEFVEIVLAPGKSRAEDRFIEVGIYDPFDLEHVVEFHAPRNLTPESQDIADDAANYVADKGLGWTWYD
jgi:ribosomal protein S16